MPDSLCTTISIEPFQTFKGAVERVSTSYYVKGWSFAILYNSIHTTNQEIRKREQRSVVSLIERSGVDGKDKGRGRLAGRRG